MLALAGCGDDGTGASAEDTTSGASTSSSGVEASTDESGSSTTAETTSVDPSASSESGDASSSSGEAPLCDCADDEVCIEIATDGCIDPHIPNLQCMALPSACAGGELECGTECGWEICSGPSCGGLGGEVCAAVSPGFVCGGFDLSCNLFTQDCDRGEKCTSWDSDTDGAFDDTRCTPVVERTVPVGGTCTVEGGPTSGIDDCEAGAMCLDYDPKTSTGICRAACTGNPFAASCDDPEMQCVLEGDYFGWCLPA